MDSFKEIFENTKTIAVIGAKKDEREYAYKVPIYMQQHYYRIIPVNPKLEGTDLFNEPVSDRVDHVIDPVDMVLIFRRSEFLDEHALEILRMQPIPKYVWFQLGIYNDNAAKLLNEKGIQVIQNRCIMVEHSGIFH
ncbi:MAG: CoA-binding protein [Ignavibacteria bacterium]|nr:CoA-binding protein [Ignavibacteria bacterium]